MKTLHADITTMLQSRRWTLAFCVKITKVLDSSVIGFTSHDKSFSLSGVTYNTGIDESAVKLTGNLSVDQLTLNNLFATGLVTKNDVLAGVYDYATVHIFYVDYTDIDASKTIPLAKGFIGEQRLMDLEVEMEFRSLIQLLQQPFGPIITAMCQVDLGSTGIRKCNLSGGIAQYTKTGTVTAVTDRANFDATISGGEESDNYYDLGLVTWTAGSNNNMKMEVVTQTYSGGTWSIELALNMPFDISDPTPDTFTIYPGCNHRIEGDCLTKFENTLNFQGFSTLPRTDDLVNIPITRE